MLGIGGGKTRLTIVYVVIAKVSFFRCDLWGGKGDFLSFLSTPLLALTFY